MRTTLTDRVSAKRLNRRRPCRSALLGLLTTLAVLLALVGGGARTSSADTLQVPGDHPTLQAAIEAAAAGDTVLVQPGTYRERIQLKAGVTLRSAGDGAKGTLGLKRAEATIINGDVPGATGPGVAMAEGSTLDGFTVTGVGTYDEAKWSKHHATRGEEQSHEHIGQPGTAGISVIGVRYCVVRDNIVHHVGYTGIAITGADGKRVAPHILRNIAYRNMGGGIGSMHGSTATIESNICFENFYAGIGHNDASPLVINNDCHGNIRAGIGVSEHASPVVRGNKCHGNRRAGIGIRTGEATAPWIESNKCYDNGMAGIGVASGARGTLVRNQCRANGSVGIGVRGRSRALILDNECLENKLVAIAIQTGSTAHITRNRLVRTGGMPPMIVIHGDSSAVITGNVIQGGGVAGVMIRGTATISGNTFHGAGPRKGGPPNFAAWVQAGATVTFSDNRVDGWRHAVHASEARRVRAIDNTIRNFLGAAIVVTDSVLPAHVFGNTAFSSDERAEAVRVTGPQGVVADNTRKAAP